MTTPSLSVFPTFKLAKHAKAFAGAPAEFVFPVKNPLCYDFVLHVDADGQHFAFERPSSDIRFGAVDRKAPALDPAVGGYPCDNVDPSRLALMATAQKNNKLKMTFTMRVWYKKFFHEALKFYIRDTGDTFTLARPDSPGPIEAAFTHSNMSQFSAKITYVDKQLEIRDVPCELTGSSITTPGAGGGINIALKLDPAKPAELDVLQALIAMDWTKIYEVGTTDENSLASPTKEIYAIWKANVAQFILGRVNMERAQRIADEVITTGSAVITSATTPVVPVIKTVRDDIDARLITANHWGDDREDWKTEAYQRKLSDLFGETHQNRWDASPVAVIRRIPAQKGLTATWGLREQALLALHMGVGHCGEHSFVSFLIIHAIMDKGANQKTVLGNVVLSGNANVDHAFVVGGVKVTDTIQTNEVTTKFSKKTKKTTRTVGPDKVIWDLKAHLASNKGVDGWVLDPYLAPHRQAETLTALLARFESAKRGSRATRFIAFGGQYPAPLPAKPPNPVAKDASSLPGMVHE